MSSIKNYLLVVVLAGLAVTYFWGQSQARGRTLAETELTAARDSLVAAESALVEQQKQHERWLEAVKEREERLEREISANETILSELEEAKKDDQTAADFGASLYHPAYLERLRRNAP